MEASRDLHDPAERSNTDVIRSQKERNEKGWDRSSILRTS